jgi:hypothetical protein
VVVASLSGEKINKPKKKGGGGVGPNLIFSPEFLLFFSQEPMQKFETL